VRYRRPIGILVATFAIVGLLLALTITTEGKGSHGAGARHGSPVSPLHSVLTALTTTTGAESFAFDFSTTFQAGTESKQQVSSPPTTTSGHGVVNLSPYVMLSSNSADSSFPNVTAVVDDTDVWEFGAGDYGTGGSGGAALGSPLPGFAQLVEGSLGQGQGALAMIALANPSGRLSLDQNMVSSVQRVGTGSVDGVPVTIYRVSIDLYRVLDQSGLSNEQQTTMSQALAILNSQGYEETSEIVSIDAAGFIREVKSVASFSNGGSMTSDTILSEIGCAGTVTPGDPVPSPPPPGCVSHDQPGSGLPSTPTTPSSSTTTTSSSTTTAIPPGAPACPAASLTARGGREGGGFVGEAEGGVLLTNIGTASCILSGNPSVVMLSSDGSQLDVEAAPPTNPAFPPVLLQPKGLATLIVYWSNWCGSPPGPLQIRITLSGDEGTLTGPFDGPPNYDFVPACRDSSQPSTLTVTHAYYAGKI
jgi:hypothetical protein